MRLRRDRLEEMIRRCEEYAGAEDLRLRSDAFPTTERRDALVRVILGASSEPYEITPVARYEFAAGWARGKTVVDCACGAGYGSRILAHQGAARVLGIDIDAPTVEYARTWYAEADTVSFERADATSVAEVAPRDTDCLVSMETIEHIQEPLVFLDEAHRLLARSGGALILSSPRPAQEGTQTPYHVEEWPLEELRANLLERWSSVRLFVQYRGMRLRGLTRLGRRTAIGRNWWMGGDAGIYALDGHGLLRRVVCELCNYIAVATRPK